MEQFKVLIITDHTNHSSENSLYAFVQAMVVHPYAAQVDVATRGIVENDPFFRKEQTTHIYTVKADEHFKFDKTGDIYKRGLSCQEISNYDLVWLRLPPPLSLDFLQYLDVVFAGQFIINNPLGIYETGSKDFLINFRALCPPMQLCTSVKDIVDFKRQFPIVLKPFREYGGKGIVKIDGDKVWQGNGESEPFAAFVEKIEQEPIRYLGVKFLNQVAQGDKRIVVVHGEIMGASLRLPASNSWLCNVSMGGSSNLTTIAEEERAMVARINPVLSKMGIAMYGVDTLVGDDGKRVLSEINTTSIGGLPQIAALKNEPLVERAINLIWDFFLEHK